MDVIEMNLQILFIAPEYVPKTGVATHCFLDVFGGKWICFVPVGDAAGNDFVNSAFSLPTRLEKSSSPVGKLQIK